MKQLISYGNTLLCKAVKPKEKRVGVFYIPSAYNEDTQWFEILSLGQKFNTDYLLNVGDKIVISESRDNVLIEHDGEKYFICSPECVIAVFLE